ncbi:MAG TPA: cytochrome C biogenesis protein, partial [Firmicutes bacterium]|nr:cytochrome C biogenesis protein [Bacillota bacterium]
AVPADGAGLNPLLQDPWMVIHPPIVFVGYALYAVPFAYAMSALARDEYSEWVKPALAWTVAAWLFLGAGIIIGAKWAYATLGWGGYWSWD